MPETLRLLMKLGAMVAMVEEVVISGNRHRLPTFDGQNRSPVRPALEA